MDSIDKNIKKIFSTYNKSFDVDLEESIMDKINVEKNYTAELSKSRKRIKIGVIISTIFLISYFGLTYLDTLPKVNRQMNMSEVYLPAICSPMLVLIMYFLFTFSYTSSKNRPDNLFFTEK